MKRALIAGFLAFGILAAVTPSRTIASKEHEALQLLCKRYRESLGKVMAAGKFAQAPDWSTAFVDVFDKTFCTK